jgi:hypothetical protein
MKRKLGPLLKIVLVLGALAMLLGGTNPATRAVGTTLFVGALTISFWSDTFTWIRHGDVVLKGYSIKKMAQPYSYRAALFVCMCIAALFTWIAAEGVAWLALELLELVG